MNKTLLRIVLIISTITFTPPQICEAQILNALKNTVQSKIKEGSKKGKKKAVEQVETQVKERIAEAIPLKPQFDPEIWFLEDKESQFPELYAKAQIAEPGSQLAREQEEAFLHCAQNIIAGKYNYWIPTEGSRYVPEYVMFTYPYARNYILNPTDDNFRLFMRSHVIRDITLDLENSANNIIDSKRGMMLYNPQPNRSIWYAMELLRNEVMKVACKKYTPNQYAQFIIEAYKEAYAVIDNPSAYPDGNAKLAAGAHFHIARSMETDARSNQDFRLSQDDQSEIKMHFQRVSDNFLKLKQLMLAASVGAQPVPAGVKVSATYQSQLLAAAKKVYGANLVKVIPTENENRWHIFKSNKFPYEEINRSLGCVCVYKKDGKTMWRECTYQINAKTKAKTIQPGEVEYEVKE